MINIDRGSSSYTRGIIVIDKAYLKERGKKKVIVYAYICMSYVCLYDVVKKIS